MDLFLSGLVLVCCHVHLSDGLCSGEGGVDGPATEGSLSLMVLNTFKLKSFADPGFLDDSAEAKALGMKRISGAFLRRFSGKYGPALPGMKMKVLLSICPLQKLKPSWSSIQWQKI